MKWGVLVTMLGVALAVASPAAADDWLPHSADATWTYQWTDSVYNSSPTNEKVTVKSTNGPAFTLAWSTTDLGNADSSPSSTGTVAFQETNSGISVVFPYWSSDGPPPNFPILCATTGQCANSLIGTYYNLIWGNLVPMLAEPLLSDSSWSATGGGDGSVASSSRYAGVERVTVPAFPDGVLAAKVTSELTQAGALGDPYGSGQRTTWWVYGVGPVKMTFQHAGGAGAPVTTSVLQSTNLTPKTLPSAVDWFPLRKGLTGTYSWTNSRHLKKPETEKYVIDQVANGSARLSVTCLSGQIKCAGLYLFTRRTDGLTNISTLAKAASTAKFPPLGPRSLPAAKRRHFFTPFDLLTFGFNPMLPEYAVAGDTWKSDPASLDYSVYGVAGVSKVLGVQTVKVPAGRFHALAVRTTIKQPGYAFGSGTRTAWFAPSRGLVKLVFKHGDGSTSVVELTK